MTAAKAKAAGPRFRDLADWSGTNPAQLVATHLDRLPNTRRCYEQDLWELARWMACDGLGEMAAHLLEQGRGPCKRLLIAWINHQRVKHLAANTIRRRVAAVTSMITMAADLEVIGWQVGRLPLPPAGRVRCCRGPSRDAVARMFARCEQRDDPKGRRDAALLALLYWHALRAMEVLSVRREDVDLAARPATLRITAKRGSGRMELALCPLAAEAIERWVEVRGDEDGPLFNCCSRWHRRVRTTPLTYWGLRAVVRSLGEAAGCRCWPHALRHAAISHLAALTGDSPLWGTALSRHRDVRAWAMYQDDEVSHVSAAEVLSRGQSVSRGPDRADNQYS